MYKDKKILAIIPARGGSKRIPGKNIKPLGGKPLINHSIEAAKSTPEIDRLIVSTDDEKIANVARGAGANVPFMRPTEIAEDSTGDHPVIKHALEYIKKSSEAYDIIVWLRPTCPLRTASDISEAIKTLCETESQLVRSVTKATGANHPYWMYTGEDGKLSPLMDGIRIKDYYQSQKLPQNVFLLNGVVDAFTTEHALGCDFIWDSDSMGYIEIAPERAADIDEEIDFLIAEALIKKNS